MVEARAAGGHPDGRLPAGTRLPSSRDLAAQLGVARGTVTLAYTQLAAEGYLRPGEVRDRGVRLGGRRRTDRP